MTLSELLHNAPLSAAYMICIAGLVQLFVIFFLQRNHIVADLRGKDLKWQFLELTGLMWLVIFPTTFIAATLGAHVSSDQWSALEAVYFMNVGGKIGHKWMDQRGTKNKNDVKDTTN